MKKILLILLVLVSALGYSFAQDEEAQPVTAFESGILIDAQTSFVPDARTLEFIIQHKFGTMENGKSDLWGIYAPGANVRLALNYVPYKNVQIGAGITKKNMYSDFNAKWKVLQQKTSGMPFSVTLYGNMAIDGRNADMIETGQIVDTKGNALPRGVKLSDRFSYFSQVFVTRKFNDWFSLQAGASFTHYNMVGWDHNHDGYGIHVNGRIKFSPQGSIIFNYDQPLKIEALSEQTTWDTHPKENVAIGVEIFTFTHAFQIYVGTADGIIPQDIMMYNQKDWLDKGLAFGFTITRLWAF